MTNLVVPDLVSTVIPAYNRGSMLGEAVHSVLQQTWQPIEIIIVDDGSTDDTLQVAKELMEQHPDAVHVIAKPNGGPGPAREAGRQRARGEFIQYLDSDDRLLPDKFTVQVEALRRHPECGIAYGKTRLIDVQGCVLKSPFKWTAREFPYLFPTLLVDRWWCTHTPLYRRSLTDLMGPWSDLRYSQDWEYDARAGARGTRLVYCPMDVSEHRTHAGIRQTGGGQWLEPMDRVRFFGLLLQHAQAAGVPAQSPEMRHFIRWTFSHARQCALLGHEDAARTLFDLACCAAGSPSVDLRVYGTLASLLGWRRTAGLAESLVAAVGRRSGPDTRPQSWTGKS